MLKVWFSNGPFIAIAIAMNGPLENQTIPNQNKNMFGIGMAFGFPSSVFEPPLYLLTS